MIKLNNIFNAGFIISLLLSSLTFSQDYKMIDSDGGKILLGTAPRSVYQDSNFASWYNTEYTNYKIDHKLIRQIGEKLEGKLIKIVLGTWCSDSRREVPRFIKILDFIDFPFDKVLLINVDREKKGLSDEVEDLQVEFVPTFIIYENGKEIGRIVEAPLESLEEDLSKIID